MFLERYLSTIPANSGWACDASFFEGLIRQPLDAEVVGGGIPLYAHQGLAYLDGGDECRHSIVFGSTGSGKTRRFLLPGILYTLLACLRSAVLFDVKGEILRMTERIARERYSVAHLNFNNPAQSTIQWNPFAVANELYKQNQQDEAFIQLNEIGALLFQDEGSVKADPFWRNTACAMFMGLCDVLWRMDKTVSLEAILSLRREIPVDDDCGLFHYVGKLGDMSVASIGLQPVISCPKNTRGCILASFDTYMQPFTARADLSRMLSGSRSFDFMELGKVPTALYISVPDDSMAVGRLQCLMLLQMQQRLNALAKAHGGTLPVRVEMFIDELCNIKPRVPQLETALALSRSRGIRYTLAVQTLSQLESVYGKDASTLADNCANWIVLYSARDETLRDKVASLCGDNPFGKPLLTPSQLAQLPIGQALVLRERRAPYITLLDDISQYGPCWQVAP